MDSNREAGSDRTVPVTAVADRPNGQVNVSLYHEQFCFYIKLAFLLSGKVREKTRWVFLIRAQDNHPFGVVSIKSY